MLNILILPCLTLLLQSLFSSALYYDNANFANDVDSPLILTPFIRANKIAEARAKSKVDYKDFQNTESYSGYFTVDENFNSNIFFWFFPSQNQIEDPLILWLQGGPGWSSLDGLFVEHGPFIVKQDGKVILRKESWNQNHSVIYIDQPVGTGYSFTNGGYAENQTIIGDHLYNALIQFFLLFPELQKSEFYVAGESYAGKYVPAIAYTIHKKNTLETFKINLQGLLIGNGLVDPGNQMVYSGYLYQLGLADLNQKMEIKKYEEKIVKNIQKGKYFEATNIFDQLIFGGKTNSPLIQNITGFKSFYNFINPSSDDVYWVDFINKTQVRRILHVGSTNFNDKKVEEKLWADITKTVAPWLSELLSYYRVLLYSGQLDIIVAYPTTEHYLRKLKFDGAEDYKRVRRQVWTIGQHIAGYTKTAGNLTEVLVRNAGHMVPADQPEWCYRLVFNFIRNIK